MHVVQLCRQWLWSEASLLDDLTWGLGDAVCHRGQQAAEAREDAHLQSEEVAGTKRKPELEVEDDRTPCVHCDHIPEGLALVYRQECVQTNPPLLRWCGMQWTWPSHGVEWQGREWGSVK